jgi:predicted DNA-binding transcriptional regulator AlpA
MKPAKRRRTTTPTKHARNLKHRTGTSFPTPTIPPGRAMLTLPEVCSRYAYKRHALRKAIIARDFPPGVRLTPVAHPRWFIEDLRRWEEETRAKSSAA